MLWFKWLSGRLIGGFPEPKPLPAHWRGGFFGIERPGLMKFFRNGQLLTDQTGFRIKVDLVDYERSTFRNPDTVDYQKIDTALVPVNRKGRLASYTIQFPSEDTDSVVMELSNSHFAIAER